MGYLIDTTIIRQHTTIIPSADAVILDSTPYEVFPAVADTYIYPVSVNLLVQKFPASTQYIGFNVIELINGTTSNIIAACRENRALLNYGYSVNLSMNNVAFPGFDPGSTIKMGEPLFLAFRLPIVSGLGDIQVIINYTSIPFV